MVWVRRGLILAPPGELPWARSHAALPVPEQTMGGTVAILFSARDEHDRARIGRATLAMHGNADARVDGVPVLDLGELGSFDDGGVTGSCVVDHGGRRYLYYSGWTRGVSVPFYFFAGCAVSEGDTFVRVSRAPILERNDVDPFLTASPWVLVEGTRWRMWYVSGTGWRMLNGRPKHWYHIKYAESDDGIAWERGGHVCVDYANEDEYALGRPCVVRDDDQYRMWFCARGSTYRLAYAESPDGLSWTRADDRARLDGEEGAWESTMQAYPVVFDADGQRHMLYNGNGYGATGIGHAVLES